ncbi:osmoprotectant transport system permease protein [Dehalogenimonas formicexedens]|uniref:Osmoprotectant transport system permease protein n=1 Tax=Dehalogenimonas formicexedens TaxID=1839801 RepID=A0A1P8F8C3_9CHLR|nr:ABC transporter permease [Dehalogenimonas formicexedens]APV44724.1 osmoprotectant transport system permease protein [Dehalogenimonas formicexedens]
MLISKKPRPMARSRRHKLRWLVLAVFTVLFMVIVANDSWWQAVLGFLFPAQDQVLHPRAPLWVFVVEHLRIVSVSSALSIALGLPLGILITRKIGRSLQPMATHLTSLAQTFPPVAVLALAVPAFGFGFKPTVFALFLYGLFPIVASTAVALNGIPATVIDSASGVGMTPLQRLWLVELPLGAPVILGGIRISVMINIGTAMIGAVIGAGGLGSPVIAGLVRFNPAFILEGTLPAAFLAILASGIISTLELSLTPRPEPAVSG